MEDYFNKKCTDYMYYFYYDLLFLLYIIIYILDHSFIYQYLFLSFSSIIWYRLLLSNSDYLEIIECVFFFSLSLRFMEYALLLLKF